VAAGGDEIPARDTTMAAEATISPAVSEAAAGDLATSTGPVASAPSSPPQMATATASAGTNDNAAEEPDAILGHPGLRLPGAVSLSEVMGMTHFALNQVHDVLTRSREDINEERLCLSMWVSMLKQQTTSMKEKVEVRQKHLDMMEILFTRRQAVADKLDTQAKKLLNNAKELYATAEAHASATIKQQEDLNAQAAAMVQQEQAVADQELKL
jgi:predicted HTH domain antitoxin